MRALLLAGCKVSASDAASLSLSFLISEMGASQGPGVKGRRQCHAHSAVWPRVSSVLVTEEKGEVSRLAEAQEHAARLMHGWL